jgi:hypothetical protein
VKKLKPRDMSDKFGCFYGELKETVPFDIRKLPESFVTVLQKCKPWTRIDPQYDDKLATEAEFVFSQLGREKEFRSLGRPMDNRIGKQVAITIYISISVDCPHVCEFKEEFEKLSAGYNGGYKLVGRRHRFCATYIGMAAILLGFRLRKPYGVSRYQKPEAEEQSNIRAYGSSNPLFDLKLSQRCVIL